jgi:predicted ester cyclase
MSTEENKTVVRRFAAAYNGRDAAVLNEVLAADAAQRYLEIHIPRNSATWADERLEITDTLAEGDWVWARVTHSARHVGEYRGIPPTGKTKTNAGCIFCRVTAGKIVEHATLWDSLGELTQLGGVVVPGEQ